MVSYGTGRHGAILWYPTVGYSAIADHVDDLCEGEAEGDLQGGGVLQGGPHLQHQEHLLGGFTQEMPSAVLAPQGRVKMFVHWKPVKLLQLHEL